MIITSCTFRTSLPNSGELILIYIEVLEHPQAESIVLTRDGPSGCFGDFAGGPKAVFAPRDNPILLASMRQPMTIFPTSQELGATEHWKVWSGGVPETASSSLRATTKFYWLERGRCCRAFHQAKNWENRSTGCKVGISAVPPRVAATMRRRSFIADSESRGKNWPDPISFRQERALEG